MRRKKKTKTTGNHEQIYQSYEDLRSAEFLDTNFVVPAKLEAQSEIFQPRGMAALAGGMAQGLGTGDQGGIICYYDHDKHFCCETAFPGNFFPNFFFFPECGPAGQCMND